jgi:hypothetical protein
MTVRTVVSAEKIYTVEGIGYTPEGAFLKTAIRLTRKRIRF